MKLRIQNGRNSDIEDPSRTLYYQGEFTLSNNKTARILLLCANQMGMTVAASLTIKVIYQFKPKLVAMCGIAAGISGNFGDVMIPDILWDYGSGKNYLDTVKTFFGRDKVVEKFAPYRFPVIIKQDLISHIIRISKETDINQRIYDEANHIEFKDKSSALKAHIGPFVSGAAVIANDKILSQIRNQDGKLIGFDMEAFAVAYAASVSNVMFQRV